MVNTFLARVWNNFFVGPWKFHRHFTPAVSSKLQAKIHETEKRHSAELKVAIEENLGLHDLFRTITSREKAYQAFSNLQVWDTEENNGVLLYILFSEHRIEIVTDRCVTSLKLDEAFGTICSRLEQAFVQEDYVSGIERAIDEITALLASHFPPLTVDKNEVSDAVEFLK
jgi:uncharacterized membrane protein YgcG